MDGAGDAGVLLVAMGTIATLGEQLLFDTLTLVQYFMVLQQLKDWDPESQN